MTINDLYIKKIVMNMTMTNFEAQEAKKIKTE